MRQTEEEMHRTARTEEWASEARIAWDRLTDAITRDVEGGATLCEVEAVLRRLPDTMRPLARSFAKKEKVRVKVQNILNELELSSILGVTVCVDSYEAEIGLTVDPVELEFELVAPKVTVLGNRLWKEGVQYLWDDSLLEQLELEKA